MLEHTTRYSITGKETVWRGRPPVTVTVIAEDRSIRWNGWLMADIDEADNRPAPDTPEPPVIHVAWEPDGDRKVWSKLDWFYWNQSAEYANQLFTEAEVNALVPYLEYRVEDISVQAVELPLSEPRRPLDTFGLPSWTIFKMGFAGSNSTVIRFNGHDFYCSVAGYYDRQEYQASLAIARQTSRRPVLNYRLNVHYNPDADGYYYVVEDDSTIHALSRPEYPTRQAAIEAGQHYLL